MNGSTDKQLLTPAAVEFRLVPAAIDFSTGKTQLTVAAGLAVVAAVGLHSAGGFAVPLMGSILVATITAEVAGAFGNRLGAAPAIWAALLFAFAPATPLQQPTLQMIAIVPLYLLSVWAFLRYRNTREKILLRMALLAMALGLFCGSVFATLPAVVLAAEFFLPTTAAAGDTPSPGASQIRMQRWIAVALFFLVMCFVGTAGRLAPGVVPMLEPNGMPPAFDDNTLRHILTPDMPGMVSAIVLISYVPALICGLLGGSHRVAMFCLVWLLASSTHPTLTYAPLSIMLATLALPLRAVPKKTATILTYAGMAALSAVAFAWFMMGRS